MVSFPRLITAFLIKSLVVGRRADLIFLSLFLYSSFTTPSGLHRQKKNRLLLCGSCFNQLPDYSNKVGFISFAGLKVFPLCDKFISSASGFQPAKMFPIQKQRYHSPDRKTHMRSHQSLNGHKAISVLKVLLPVIHV